tara:strand:+ start:50 stop:772 length:723 start_codon:yes stop_codon:yes gene_type:complete
MVVFERLMTITYEAEQWDDVESLERQVQYLLHLDGLNLVSRYRWNTKIDDDKYGYQTVEDTDTTYPVYITDVEAFRLHYYSEAERAVEGLIASGHNNARYKTETTTTTKEKWIEVHGAFFIFNYETLEGESNMYGDPSLTYGENLDMVTTLESNSESVWKLQFRITYDAESVDERKEASDQLVNVPLKDMRHIRKTIESILGTFTVDCDPTFTVDCVSCIKSETTAKCEPITIEKVMKDE